VTRRETDEDGSMLVELIVAMVLMSVVGVMVLNAVIGGFKGQRQLQDRGQALAEIRTAAQRITREIREADPVLAATPSLLTVRHDQTVGGTVRRTWEYVTVGTVTSLQQTTVTTSAAGVDSAAVVTTVISNIDPTVTLFTVTPVPGWTPPAGSVVNPLTCEKSLSPVTYARECVGTVSMHLSRLIPGHTPVSVDATVDLRNT
jgi:type II secretory pathway pseudopilin PulG